jgi:Ni/Co efflux regulator RcnB
MHKIIIGALALSFVSASVASAQPYNHDHQDGRYESDHRDRDRFDDRGRDHDRGDDRRAGERRDGRWNHGWRNHHRPHMVCSWRHHRRVCYPRHW